MNNTSKRIVITTAIVSSALPSFLMLFSAGRKNLNTHALLYPDWYQGIVEHGVTLTTLALLAICYFKAKKRKDLATATIPLIILSIGIFDLPYIFALINNKPSTSPILSNTLATLTLTSLIMCLIVLMKKNEQDETKTVIPAKKPQKI